MNIKELEERRKELIKKQQKEYTTRGNTQRCQEIFSEILEIEKEIEKQEKTK